jgi:hypothetical protein
MPQSTLQAGDRIRLVTFAVAIADPDGAFSTRKVNLRFSWTGPHPEHVCSAHIDQCFTCDAEVQRIVKRRLETGHRIVGIAAIRDGQTTMIDRRPTPVALKAAA